MSRGKVEDKKIDDYKVLLKEKYRPPSKGGNTAALHSHILLIDGDTYSFLALGSQQWAYKTDTVFFEYEMKGEYRNVLKKTVRTIDREGNVVVRGNRGFKKRLRSAEPRMPVSRREMGD